MGAFLAKETLFWVPFSIDLALCLIQFPLFLIKGPQWFAQVCGEDDDDDDAASSKKKDDDAGDDDKKERKKIVPKVDSNYVMLYDTFLLCYSGYCSLMLYGLYSVLQHPESLLPPFGGVMFGVILAKAKLMSQWKNRAKKGDGGNDKLRKSKTNSLLSIYVPTYGGYCLLYALEWYKDRTA